jgi:hypothetical protein
LRGPEGFHTRERSASSTDPTTRSVSDMPFPPLPGEGARRAGGGRGARRAGGGRGARRAGGGRGARRAGGGFAPTPGRPECPAQVPRAGSARAGEEADRSIPSRIWPGIRMIETPRRPPAPTRECGRRRGRGRRRDQPFPSPASSWSLPAIARRATLPSRKATAGKRREGPGVTANVEWTTRRPGRKNPARWIFSVNGVRRGWSAVGGVFSPGGSGARR